MVINGLTYDSVGNRILLKYNSLDGTRGGTTINRYTIDDIWETVLANNWTDYLVKSGNSYFFKIPFIIEDCYVKFENITLEVHFDDTDGVTKNMHWISIDILSTNCRFASDSTKTGIGYSFRHNSSTWISIGDVFYNWYGLSYASGNYTIINPRYTKIYNFYPIPSIASNVTAVNWHSIDSTYGIIPQNDFQSADGIIAEDCRRGILMGYGNFTINNFKAVNCRNDILVNINQTNQLGILIDPQLDINKVELQGGTGITLEGRSGTEILKSTFNILSNVEDADYTIIDNYGNEVNGTLVEGKGTELMPYWTYEGLRVNDVTTFEVLRDYQPFRVIVKKNGFETVEYSDIYITETDGDKEITDGLPIVIRAELKKAIEVMATRTGGIIKANPSNYGKDREVAF
ncbi:MAG TPA: hypothetical protein VFC79_01455, partial [Tissierellaceae bacterium]|nr:hypothetical protein [Tissierellaceae bacterium]